MINIQSKPPIYDPEAVQPMRDELVYCGFEELTTPDKVEEVLSLKYADAWIHDSVAEIPVYQSLPALGELGVNRTGRTTGGGGLYYCPERH